MIEVHLINPPKAPLLIKDWRYPSIRDGQWTFWFQHDHKDVGVKYRIRIQMFHRQKPLLLELDYFVIVNNTPHRETVNLSPIGQLYVEVQSHRDISAEESVTVRLHEVDQPHTELLRVSHDEQTATSIYLKYNPDNVLPGKHYSLTSTENRYGQTLAVTPGLVELVPTQLQMPGYQYVLDPAVRNG